MRARFVQYHQRVLATDPIAYWMLDEKSGTVAYDLVSGHVAGAQNGTHTGVTLGQDGIGDGRTSTFYDGANDYTNLLAAAAAFNGSTGTVMCWGRVTAAGTWTDGSNRTLVRVTVNANHYLYLRKTSANNTLGWRFVGNTVGAITTRAAVTTLGFFNMAMTWEGGFYQAYYNGVAQGAPVATGVWAGVPTILAIGAANLVPAAVWNGTAGSCTFWDRALSASEIADTAVIE